MKLSYFQSYFSKTQQTSVSRDSDATVSKTFDASRKISSGATLSSDLNTNNSKADRDGTKQIVCLELIANVSTL